MTKARDVMHLGADCIDQNETLAAAAELMRDLHVGKRAADLRPRQPSTWDNHRPGHRGERDRRRARSADDHRR